MLKSITIDTDSCVGCGACVVTCMDQNDLYPEKGQPSLRSIFSIEDNKSPEVSIQYISASCMHCEDSPCIIGCPTGAISKNSTTGAVVINRDLCIGCHSCALACPFGVPRYDINDKMYKCNLCSPRVENGYLPACVKVCPFDALKYESINDTMQRKEAIYVDKIVLASSKAAEN